MEARKISNKELQKWIACPLSENDKNYVRWIKNEQEWINDNDIKIENMFVVEENGKFLMKLCVLDENREHILFLTPVIGNFPNKEVIAKRMFEFLIQEAKNRNVQRVEAIIDNETENFNLFVDALQTTGFKINKRKHLFNKNLTEEITIKPLPDLITMKTIEEVGRDKFKQLFIKCVENSFDTIDDLLPQSPEALYNELCEDEETNMDLWKVFCKGDTPIAFILPAEIADSLGTLKYIGTLPEHRRKGLGSIFFLKGLEFLKSKGVKYYLGSTAYSNKPMIKIFENCGCKINMLRVELVYIFE
jgi:GNAT superfamily N-acetyltransferase